MRLTRSSLGLAIGLVAAGAGASASAQDAARVQPRSYRVVLDNDRVRVTEYAAKPSLGVCGVGVHSHPAHLTVLLTPARVKITQNGAARIVESKAGDTFWEPPVTHEVENYGHGGEVRSLIIEIKAAGQSPVPK